MGCCCGDSDEAPKGNPLKRNVCCTDILFLVIFIAFWGGMIYIAAFSVIQGDATRLVYGYDSFGNTCNKVNEDIANISLSGKDVYGSENVFFMDILDPFDAMQLCVSKCPADTIDSKEKLYEFAIETNSKLCRYDILVEDYKTLPDKDFDKGGPCPELPIYASVSLLNRCVPDVAKLAASVPDQIKNVTSGIYAFLNADDIFRRVLSDLYSSWKEMLVLCFVALGIALLMVLCIRYLASVVVWIIVVLAAVGSIAGTAFLWWTYYDTKTGLDADENLDIPLLSVDISNEKAFLVFSIIATVLTVILLLILLVMRTRIALTVALFHEAGKCIADTPLLLLQPVWTFLFLMIFFVFWIVIFAFISTAGYPEVDYDKFEVESVIYKKDTVVRVFWWYYVIGLIWTSEFILACQQMVIAGTVTTWYFTRDKASLSCTVGKATSRLILHHIGSVAFGSFIILLVKLPRLILMYIQNKCKGSENAVAQCCLKCCICCLWCLEQFLKFLNQNAYTVIAIEGKSFCAAASRAFTIIASNVLRVAAINSVGDFVLFLGKIGVMAGTAAVGIVWLKENEELHYFAVPVLLCCVFSFLIAHCFLSTYEMVIDTLLLCFCEDCQMNDGTDDRRYFMSTSLMEFVKNSSEALANLDKSKNKSELEASETTELQNKN
jgi:solute carrier family 44 protein 1 (choline transporter-like protein)